MTNCECTLAGYCKRHNVEKSDRMVELCQTHESYWKAWEEGRGPRQIKGPGPQPQQQVVTPEFVDPGEIISRNPISNWELIHQRLADCVNASTSKKAFDDFKASVEQHNKESITKKKPTMSLLEAMGKYRVNGQKADRVIIVYAEEAHLPVMNVARPFMQAYAEKCNAHFVELTGVFHHKFNLADKYRMADVAWNYKQALLLDSDIIIHPSSPNIFELYNDYQFAGADEIAHYGRLSPPDWYKDEIKEFYKSQGVSHDPIVGVNCGVMLFNDVPTMCELYSEPKLPYPKFWCAEQFWLWYQLTKVRWANIPQKWNWAWIRKDFREHINDAYFIHFNGIKDLNTRVSEMQSVLSVLNTPTTGPGTILHNYLSKLGIEPTSSCNCSNYTMIMNSWGPMLCRTKVHVIVGWLREEAKKRKLPFSTLAANQLVKWAIHQSEKSLRNSEKLLDGSNLTS